MDSRFVRRPWVAAALWMACAAAHAQSLVPAALSVQGRLTSASGTPVPNTTSQTMSFRLYSLAAGGSLLWSETLTNVPVTNGVFSANLNLASGFTAGNTLDTVIAAKPYLEIAAGADPPMTPRIPLASSAYALRARVAETVSPGALNGAAWLVGGNAGTNPATQFAGTIDNRPFSLRANNRRGLLLEDRADAANTYHATNVIAGSPVNTVAASVLGATIAGGGQDMNTGADAPNDVRGDFGTVGGGAGNFIDAFPYGTIAGGAGNVLQGGYSAVGGGTGNNVQGGTGVIAGGTGNFLAGESSTIGGGSTNSVTGNASTVAGGYTNVAGASAATIAGGQGNIASAVYASVGGGFGNKSTHQYTTTAGGYQNQASAFVATAVGGSRQVAAGQYSFIGGGSSNVVNGDTSIVVGGDRNTVNGTFTSIGGGRQNYGWSVSDFSVIGGGFSNAVYGDFAAIPGGYKNSADGLSSFAAGYRAFAAHDGAFVWSDAHEADFVSAAANEFCIRATGGIVLEAFGDFPFFTGVGSGEANRFVLLLNSPRAPSASGLKAGGILCADSFNYASPGKNNMVVKGTLGVGYPDPSPYTFAVNGTVYAHDSYHSSDARLKTDVLTLPDALDTVRALRGVSFLWKEQPGESARMPGRHLGFIAQEVEGVLPEVVTEDARGYKAVSYESIVPVLVEAVKEQQRQIESRDARLADLERENRSMEARLLALERAVSKGR